MSYHAIGAAESEQERQYYTMLIQQPAPTLCPECSYMEGGSCHWCPDGADIPGCEGCIARQRPPPPWYKRSEIVAPMLIAVATTVTAAIVTQAALRRLRLGPRRSN